MYNLAIVNGTFDILHLGHLKLLEAAKAESDKVLVAIDRDDRVRELKGPDRPINNQYFRANMLLALKYVDYVQFFSSEEELRSIIRSTNADIMFKGSDYIGKSIIGADLVPIKFIEVTDESTTKFLQRISNR